MITAILISSIVFFNVLMDLSSEGKLGPGWWDKNDGWEYKWKLGLPLMPRKKWYYLWIFTPKYKEKFLYSSTIFVSLTDGWHLFQNFFHSSWQLLYALETEKPLATFLITKGLFSLGFELGYFILNVKADLKKASFICVFYVILYHLTYNILGNLGMFCC
jgi:hypothetical protein